MFNNDNPQTNGENLFYTSIKNRIQVIFDVGCRDGSDGNFLDFDGHVHYFDPVHNYIDIISSKPNNNKLSKFNTFGLGNENEFKTFFPNFGSFIDRFVSTKINDNENKIILEIVKSVDYVNKNKINFIDFLKIDTEGYELEVVKGFEDFIENVKIIQFEYGGTYIDSNVKLIDIVEYLKSYNFDDFSYLTPNGYEKIIDFSDHYNYCNIVCFNKNKNIEL